MGHDPMSLLQEVPKTITRGQKGFNRRVNHCGRFWVTCQAGWRSSGKQWGENFREHLPPFRGLRTRLPRPSNRIPLIPSEAAGSTICSPRSVARQHGLCIPRRIPSEQAVVLGISATWERVQSCITSPRIHSRLRQILGTSHRILIAGCRSPVLRPCRTSVRGRDHADGHRNSESYYPRANSKAQRTFGSLQQLYRSWRIHYRAGNSGDSCPSGKKVRAGGAPRARWS